MKKTTTLLTAAAFTVISTAIFAHDFGGNTGQMNNSFDRPHHQIHDEFGPKHGKKMCRKGRHGGKDYQNISPEKREALMQLKVENKIEFMTKKLTLSSEQQNKLRDILRDKQQKKMLLKQESKEKIKQILTDEQQAKFESKM